MPGRRILALAPSSIDHFTPIWNSVRALCEHGDTVDLISPLHNPARSPYRHPSLHVHSKLTWGKSYWPRLFALAARRPALAWIHDPAILASPIASLLHFLRVPIVYHAHELYDRDTHGPRIRWASLVLCPEAGRARIIREWMDPASAQIVLPNTRYEGAVQPAGRLRALLGGRTVCIYQGLIAARRNITQLVDAMAHVPDTIGLVIIGDGATEDLEACDQRIRQQNLGNRVLRIPPVGIEEILQLTADADLGILLYDQSHSLNNRLCAPNKLFEYMMIGLPMIGTRCPGLDPFLSGLNLGELVDSTDCMDIAAAIRRLGTDAARRQAIGTRGKALFREEWTYEKQVKQVFEYLDQRLGS